MSDQLTVVIIPPPTVNGALHVGHLAGPYLAADMVARAARTRGDRVLAVGGVDVHQNYVLTRAENEGRNPEDMVTHFRSRIETALRLARIRCDAAVDPQDPVHHREVAGLVEDMVRLGVLRMRAWALHFCQDCGRTLHHSYVSGECSCCGCESSGGSCEGCGAFTSAQTLVDPVCDRCGGLPRSEVVTIPVLAMEDYRDALIQTWTTAVYPPRVRALIAHYLADQLPDIPVAYPTDWGIAGTGALTGLRLDVYVEVALGTLLCIARTIDGSSQTSDSVRTALRRVHRMWHVNGIDNSFYFAILWPAVYLAMGLTPEQIAGAVVNEFYTLEGAKFSTSRNHAIWADEFLAAEDVELVRLYLAWDRPDRSSSDFTDQSYRAFAGRMRLLLDGSVTTGCALPGPLLMAELDRAERALEPTGFDPALAVRGLMMALGTGVATARVAALLGAISGLDEE